MMRAGWNKGEIRSKMFRHTYCSARLQTLDGGAPVSPFTVSKELGHGERRWWSVSTHISERFAIALTWWSTVSRATERHLGTGSQPWKS
jgi:hypothetical protein